MRDRSTKMLAVLMVSLMAVVALAPLAGEETDAAVGDGGAYSYTLTYHSDQMGNAAAQETQLTVDGMTPISHASGTTTLTTLANVGSWGWNTTTGIGPFNSFYGAFDMTDGNKFVSILNPYNLTKMIDGTDLDDMTKYNIMWVLPTVYWSVDGSGNITLSNDPTAGTAYAHTIDGHVYKYIAIGVYEGFLKTSDSTTYLTSQSGATPSSNTTLSEFRNGASAYTLDATLGENAHSMLWTFYQWELYKYCCYIVMEGFNSQTIVGNGIVYGSTYANQTGSLNTSGPYSGNPGIITDNTTAESYGSNSVKLFLENVWGGLGEIVENAIYRSSGNTLFINTSSTPTSSTSSETLEQIAYTMPNGYSSAISTNDKTWGLGTNGSGSATIGLTDKSQKYSTNAIGIGGPSSTSYSGSLDAGLSFISADRELSSGLGGTYGSRLAFVIDSLGMCNVSFEIDGEGYGALSSTDTISVEVGSEITISGTTGNVLTIGENTITATPTAATSDYTYSFDGWFNGSTQLQTGDTVDEDMTITAKFSRAAILTVTLDAGKGTVSSSSLTVVEGQPIGDLPTPTPKAGYTFTGWFDSEGNEVTSETIVTETESFTLYAQYELDDSLKPVKAMTDLLPLIFVVGIIILMIGTAFYYYRP